VHIHISLELNQTIRRVLIALSANRQLYRSKHFLVQCPQTRSSPASGAGGSKRGPCRFSAEFSKTGLWVTCPRPFVLPSSHLPGGKPATIHGIPAKGAKMVARRANCEKAPCVFAELR
jgi:hypothetical protein